MTRRPSPIWTAFAAWVAFLAVYVALTLGERRSAPEPVAAQPRQVVRRTVVVEDAPAPTPTPAPVVTRSS